MNEPSRIAERQAADMAVDATTMNLNDGTSENLPRMTITRHILIEPGLWNPGDGKSGPRPSI